jgi:hypothetical protein
VRVLALLAVVATALAAATGVSAATATHECDGLQICVPVAGPWVVVPTSAAASTVEYQLDCPRGYIVGGLDAELTSNAIDLSFAGSIGSPVNPGITTARSAVFTGTYVGLDTRSAQSFRPHIGCIPASGGGGRVPTSVTAIVRPGHPTTRRVQTVRVPVGTSRVASACMSGERLIAASHAVGFFTQAPPGSGLSETVQTAQVVRASRAVVSVRAGKAIGSVRAVVQVGVVCAGGK